MQEPFEFEAGQKPITEKKSKIENLPKKVAQIHMSVPDYCCKMRICPRKFINSYHT
jgi:hypothetical protein